MNEAYHHHLWIGFTTTELSTFFQPCHIITYAIFQALIPPVIPISLFRFIHPCWSQRVVLQSHFRYSLTPKYLIVCNWHIPKRLLSMSRTFFISFIKVDITVLLMTKKMLIHHFLSLIRVRLENIWEVALVMAWHHLLHLSKWVSQPWETETQALLSSRLKRR